jgi:cystathionine beta-lyase family protein involved in aluminum resistance
MAPQTVGEALKGGRLLAAIAFDCGIPATPPHDESTAIIPSFITQLKLGTRARMLLFCTAVQAASPVGSYVTPTPGTLSAEAAHESSICCPYNNRVDPLSFTLYDEVS